ncbi:hypothetical protein [Tsuneonella sp. HG222]
MFIASPSDLTDERVVIPEVINDWNAAHGLPNNIVFLPIKWETHATPQLGERPQELINQQILRDCDLLVALFWTRIGQSTGKEESGTVEEIKEFVNKGKPALLYFSERPVPPNKIDAEQLGRLNAFKDEIKSQGLIDTFSDLYDFRAKLSRQLGMTIGRIVSEKAKIPKTKAAAIKTAYTPNLTDDEIRNWLFKAFAITAKEDGSSNLSTFAGYLARYTPVDYKALGFAKLKPFLESHEMFDFEVISPTHQLVRLRR